MQQRQGNRMRRRIVIVLLMGGLALVNAEEIAQTVETAWKLEAEATDKYWGCGLCEGERNCLDEWSGGLGAQLCYPHSFVDFMPVPRGKTLIIGYAQGGNMFVGEPSHSVSISINGEKLVNPDSLNPARWAEHKYWWPLEDTGMAEYAVDVSDYLTMDTNWVRLQREHVHLIVIDYIKVLDTEIPIVNRAVKPQFPSVSASMLQKQLFIQGVPAGRGRVEFLDMRGRILTTLNRVSFRRGLNEISLSSLKISGITLIRLRLNTGKSVVVRMVQVNMI